MKNTQLIRSSLITSALMAVCAASSLFADTLQEVSPLVALVRKSYNAQASFSTKFTLTIFWNAREKEERKTGAIACASNNRFRVTAGNETFVSNGTTFWNYSSGGHQVVIKPLAAVDQSLLPSRIFTRYLIDCPFHEQKQEGEETVLSWQGDPARPGPSAYSAIRVWVHGKSGRITKCVMTDRNGNTFTYAFSRTIFGRSFSREVFEFAPPKNAHVVDQRN